MTNPGPITPAERVLDRGALERVLARAMELHVRSEDSGGGEGATDELSESRVLDIAREVGIAPEAVRQAIAEERARAPLVLAAQESDAMLGDPTVSAARLVRGSVAEQMGRLEALLTRDETLAVIRRFPDRLVFEPRRGILDQLARGVDFGGRGYYLSRASEVVVSVAAIDDARVHVAMAADLQRARSRKLATPVILAAVGALGGVPIMLLTLFPWLAVVPPLVLGWAGWLWARHSWRTMRRQTMVTIERLLDRLEFPEKPSTARQLLDGLSKSLLPPR